MCIFGKIYCMPPPILRIVCILLSIFSTTVISAQQKKLVWSDEFDYKGLPDRTKWSYDTGGHGWGNNELQYYTADRLENARVDKGVLIIEAKKEKFKDKKFT